MHCLEHSLTGMLADGLVLGIASALFSVHKIVTTLVCQAPLGILPHRVPKPRALPRCGCSAAPDTSGLPPYADLSALKEK